MPAYGASRKLLRNKEMVQLPLVKAQLALSAALEYARKHALAPMTIAILDARGVLKVFAAEDATPLRRADIAIGKAYGALAMGAGSRSLQKRAEQQPSFIAAATQAVGDKEIIGAIGVTGDKSDNDEATVPAGLAAANLAADPS
jgi:uncharacterized protein GlcG (DUF336 family)